MKTALSALKRDQDIKRLKNEVFDLVIVGGGINGAGVARDAASRGMSVAVIEARDFAVGTSSRSSKLVHGGIRYLENLEFGLVFEALAERRRLFEIAPHLVHPLRFVIPLFKGGRVGPGKMGLGMFLYDALAMFETPEPAERLSVADVERHLPLLNTHALEAAFAYSDAYMDDDRLVLETLRSATAMGAVAVNYVRAEGGVHDDGRLTAVTARDQVGGGEFQIRGRHFVSTVGPWTDLVAPKLLPDWQRRLRPSKGVHLTFTRDRLPLNQAVVMAAEERIVFGIPRHEMVIVGTTDTDFAADPATVATDRADVTYLLGVLDRYFPGARIRDNDIVASYAGVRPLVDDRSATESKTSREHLIVTDSRNVTFVMGGKYTTYRQMAEQTVDAALSAYPLEDQVRFARSNTVQPLNPLVTAEAYAGGEAWVKRLGRDGKWPEPLLVALFDRHGHEAEAILNRHENMLNWAELSDFRARAGDPRGTRPWEQVLWAFEAAHAVHETACRNLADFYFRRSHLILSRPDHGQPFLNTVASVMQNELGWSDADLKNQYDMLRQEAEYEFRWRLNSNS